jgi:two-component system OmpR family sensor kinase
MLRRTRPRKLYRRLAIGFAVITVSGFALALLASYAVLSRQMQDRVDSALSYALQSRVQELRASGDFPAPGVRTLAALYAPDGTELQHKQGSLAGGISLRLTERQLLADARTGQPVALGMDDYQVDVARIPDGRYVAVAESSAADQSTLDRMLVTQELISLPLLAVVLGGALWFSRRMLSPVQAVTRTALCVMKSDEDLSHRVVPGYSSQETQEMADAFNTMLDRIEKEFTRRRKAEAELRDFVAAASHELRTPLTTISGYAQLARLGALADENERQQAMKRVQSEASRMTELVDELLLLARLDQGRPLERTPVDLAKLCREVVADSRIRHPDRDFRLTAAPGAHTVLGDPHRLGQVLINLLSNVAQHTPPGTGADIRLSRDDRWEVVDVVDEGPGIPEELHGPVFERFFQGTRRPQGQRPGNGLGLSVVAAIAAAHGGRVTIQPSQRGAWFRLSVPANAPAS